MYQFYDMFFCTLHIAVICFNLFGWISDKTKRANLILLIATGCSWFLLGIWYGIGYCPLTDWHWQVLDKLGHKNLPNSYVKYLADRITGLDFNPTFVDTLVVVLFLFAVIASLYVNKDLFIKKDSSQS